MPILDRCSESVRSNTSRNAATSGYKRDTVLKSTGGGRRGTLLPSRTYSTHVRRYKTSGPVKVRCQLCGHRGPAGRTLRPNAASWSHPSSDTRDVFACACPTGSINYQSGIRHGCPAGVEPLALGTRPPFSVHGMPAFGMQPLGYCSPTARRIWPSVKQKVRADHFGDLLLRRQSPRVPFGLFSQFYSKPLPSKMKDSPGVLGD